MPTGSSSDRRSFLGRVAAVGVAASIPALAKAADPDPIFPAIETHRAAWAAYRPAADSAWERKDAGSQGSADRAYEAIRDAWDAQLDTPPTTLAGLKAALAHLIDRESDVMPDDTRALLEGLLEAPLLV